MFSGTVVSVDGISSTRGSGSLMRLLEKSATNPTISSPPFNTRAIRDSGVFHSETITRWPRMRACPQRLAYRTQIEGIDTSLSYTFYQDQLAQAKYVFEPQHEDSSNFIHDFHAVQDWINRSYGAPTSVQEIWLDNLYQYDKSLWDLSPVSYPMFKFPQNRSPQLPGGRNRLVGFDV